MLTFDITYGRGWTRREINYEPDVTLDINKDRRPMVIGDFAHLPFKSESADLIIFDPPFTVYGHNKDKSFNINFGGFTDINSATISIRSTFSECKRILSPDGCVLLKWGTNHRPLTWILSLTDMKSNILIERRSLASSPWKRFSHRARVYWVELHQ